MRHQSDPVAQLRFIADKSMALFFHHRFRPESKAGGDAGIFHRLIGLGLVDVVGEAGVDRARLNQDDLNSAVAQLMRSASDQASSANLLAA